MSAEQDGEEAALKMKAVFGFLEDHALGAVHDFVGDFDAAIGGQAVHDDGGLRRPGEEFGIDLVGPKDGEALGFFGFLAHGDPGIGIDDIGVLDDGIGIVGRCKIQSRALAHDAVDEVGFQFIAGGEAIRKRTPNLAQAIMRERATLLPSPT